MNIRDLHVDGFGVWHELELEKFSDELTVLHGPNEAGKSTLMQFIRAVLYGFSPEHHERYLPPLRGKQSGGKLRIDTTRGEFSVAREDDPEAEGRNAGLVKLTNKSGLVPTDIDLKALLSEIDERTFHNIYAVGIRELQELGTLSDSAAAESLYNLTAGLDRVSLSDVVRELKLARGRLLAPEDQPSRIAELIEQQEGLQTRIEELKGQTDEYLVLCSERDNLEPRVREFQRETSDLERQMRMIEVSLSLRPRWEARSETEAKLNLMGEPRPIRPQVLDELKQFDEQLAQHRKELRELKHQRESLQERCDLLDFNEALWKQAPRIEAASDHRDLLENLQRQTARLRQRLAKLENRARHYQQRPGLKFAENNPGPEGGLEKKLGELKRLAQSISEQKKQLSRAESSTSKAKQRVSELSNQLHQRLGTDPSDDLTTVLEQSGDRVSQSRRRIHLDERLEKLGHEKTELEETSDRMIERQLLSGWALTGIGAMFIVGIASLLLLIISTVLPIVEDTSSTWWLGSIGMGLTVAAVIIKKSLEHDARKQLSDVQEQLDTVHRQIAKIREERDEIDASLPGGGGPMVVRLQSAEQQHSALEDLLPLESQRKEAMAKEESANQRVGTLKQELQSLEQRWHSELRQLQLPADWSPKQLGSLTRGRKRLSTLNRRREQLRQDIELQEKTLASMSHRIAELVEASELETETDDPIEQLAFLSRELAAQQGIAQQRDELRGELKQVDRQRSKLRHQKEDTIRYRLDLLTAYECEDEAQLGEAVAQRQRYEKLLQRREELQREIAAALQQQFTEREVGGLLDEFSAKQLEQQWDELTTQHSSLESRREELLEERGRIAERLATLTQSRELADSQLELGQVEIQLQQAIEQWQALAVTDKLLGTIREQYQRERQPETLREASGYFEKLTEGAYRRVWTPLEEDVLLVDDADGNTVSVKVLSRGTREQLFLSLRLALVAAYARRDIQLPLVLDDLLVNFDNSRAKATARLLRDFAAEGHQILIFTCHDHIVKIFRALKVDIRRLPSRTEAKEKPKQPVPDIPKPEPKPQPRKKIEPVVEEVPEVITIDQILVTIEPEKPKVIVEETTVIEEPIVAPTRVLIDTEEYEAAETIFPAKVIVRPSLEEYELAENTTLGIQSGDSAVSNHTRAVAYETWQGAKSTSERELLAEAESYLARRKSRRIDSADSPSPWHLASGASEYPTDDSLLGDDLVSEDEAARPQNADRNGESQEQPASKPRKSKPGKS